MRSAESVAEKTIRKRWENKMLYKNVDELVELISYYTERVTKTQVKEINIRYWKSRNIKDLEIILDKWRKLEKEMGDE
jgi:phosphoribosylaminoimidazole carboxylase (NCAIR synthetase)